MPRKFLTAIFLLAACTKNEPPLHHAGGGGGALMDFSPPKDAPDEFWCEDDSVPETKAGAGSCYRTAAECDHMSEHLWTEYAKPAPAPACKKRPHAYCFDMNSRGTLYEVCRSTSAGCAAHHEQQSRDSWVHAITASCQER
jgi:hypothetical protein